MATLRSNLLISTAALLLVGSIRPVFNAVVNRVFGPEVNGHAANLIALIFLASLPATAGLPTVMVRHVSRALGAADPDEAAGYARLAAHLTIALTALGVLAACVHGAALAGSPLSILDLGFVTLGISGYAYWRLIRSLLLSRGEALLSLKAEIISVAALGVGLIIAVLKRSPNAAVAAFIAVYWVFAAATLSRVRPFLHRGRLDTGARSAFVRYTLLWFIASGASLAVKELSILLLDTRVERAVVGEFSVALSLLMILALASRVLELPLLHELSALAGKEDGERQRELTATSLDWMWVIMIPSGYGLAMLAAPILRIVGNVNTPLIALAFATIAVAFTAEMVVTPANDLLVSEAHPSVLAIIGASSLAAAFLWWSSPLSEGLMGVVFGLAIAHFVRAIAVAWYARSRYRVPLVRRPAEKLFVLLGGAGLIGAVHGADMSPWLAFSVFEGAALILFSREIRAMAATIRSREIAE